MRALAEGCLVTVAAALLVAVALPAPASATFPGANGLVVFYRTSAAPTETAAAATGIYVVDPVTGRQRQVKPESASEAFQGPVWSPDGSRIAYTVVHRVGDRWVPDIATMDADGRNGMRITETHDAVDPAWSPDGSMIAFRSQLESEGPNQVIGIVNSDGTGLRRVTPGVDVDWSPDCTRLVFARWYGPGDRRIETVAPDGVGSVLASGAVGADPTWSPDGRRIGFRRVEAATEAPLFESRNSLYVVEADGAGERRVGPIVQEPSWSPDGRQFVFVGDRVDLWTMAADGSGRRALTSEGPAFFSVQPDWQPAGGRPLAPRSCDAWRSFGVRRALRLAVRPRTARVGRTTRFVFRATSRRRGEPGVLIRFTGRRVRTGARGVGVLRAHLRRPGRPRAIATKAGFSRGTAVIRVTR